MGTVLWVPIEFLWRVVKVRNFWFLVGNVGLVYGAAILLNLLLQLAIPWFVTTDILPWQNVRESHNIVEVTFTTHRFFICVGIMYVSIRLLVHKDMTTWKVYKLTSAALIAVSSFLLSVSLWD